MKLSHPKLSYREGKEDKFQAGFLSTSKKLQVPISQIDSKKVLRDASEYWNYLTSGKPYDVRQYGLLYFIIDCCSEIEVRGWVIDGFLKTELANTKAMLNKMNEMLLKLEEELNKTEPTFRLSKYTVLISECIDKIPGKKAQRLGRSLLSPGDRRASNVMHDITKMENYSARPLESAKSKVAEVPTGSVDMVLSILKDYIMARKISIENLISSFKSPEDKITIEDFRNKLKALLGNQVKLSEIEEFVVGIHRSKKDTTEGDDTVSLSRVYRKIEKAFERDRAIHFKETIKEEQGTLLEDLNSPDSSNISRSMKNFVDLYTEFGLNNEQLDDELREVITDFFVQVKIKREQDTLENYKRSLDLLINSFRKKHYNLYLLKMLKYLLRHFEVIFTQQTDEDIHSSKYPKKHAARSPSGKLNRFKTIQLVFVQSDCLKFCLNTIREGSPKKLVLEAIEVMNLMLKNGHRQVQNYVFEFLKSSPLTTSFVTFIKLQLWHTIDTFHTIRENQDNMSPDIDYSAKTEEDEKNYHSEVSLDLKLTEGVINMMQLFCENCHGGFQVYFNYSTHALSLI